MAIRPRKLLPSRRCQALRENADALPVCPTPFSTAKSSQFPKIALRLWLPHISTEAYTGIPVVHIKEGRPVSKPQRSIIFALGAFLSPLNWVLLIRSN